MKAHIIDETIRHVLEDGVAEVIERKSLEERLRSGKPLTVKLGADPSRPDLHLGHAVVLRKLKELQALGHRIVFVIGDFTALIGDPSEQRSGRPPLQEPAVREYAATYKKQAGKILDIGKTEIRYNSEWFSRMRLGDFMRVARHVSFSRIAEREDFRKRLSAGKEVGLAEAFYQVLQAYDSVEIRADLELGGQDQKVNVLAGRELQKKLGQRPQDVLLTPLLIGTDGTQKMSKSLGNYIAVTDSAEEMVGKTMSIPDALILHYAELAAFLPAETRARLEHETRKDPRGAKLFVAEKIAALYWGAEAAARAREIFNARFSKRGAGEEAYQEREFPAGTYPLVDFVVRIGGAASRSAARRVILGGGVEIDHAVVRDPSFRVVANAPFHIRVGKKKFFRIIPVKNPA